MINESELEKKLEGDIRSTVTSYLSNTYPDLSPDSFAESDIRKTFDEICRDKQKITADKRKLLDDILLDFMKYIEDLQEIDDYETEDQDSPKV